MADRKAPVRISHAEIKAGVFLTFCLALFVSMLFVLGKFGRTWHGRQPISVAFTHVSALRPEAPVRYNGLEIGNVKTISIIRIDEALLKKFPPLKRTDLQNLPLTDAEREKLGAVPDAQLDAQVRAWVLDRSMALLTLDLLAENDSQRFRVDDEYRITGSLMGDSAVEVRTGAGPVVPLNYDQYFVGVGGDMYTDLGKSISQVKDILGSMAEMVGGDNSRQTVSDQLTNFDQFTARLESVSGSLSQHLPETWDTMDQRVTSIQNTLNDVESRVVKMKPDLDQTLENARKSIGDIQKDVTQSLQEIKEKIDRQRQSGKETIAGWRKTLDQYKESLPAQIKDARTWTDDFMPTVDKIDAFFRRADDQLNKGVDSTRAALKEYIDAAGKFEEMTYRLKRWPWSFAHTPSDEEAHLQSLAWREDLARRQYMELRAELERTRRSLGQVVESDRPRVARADQLIREADTLLDVGKIPSAESEPVKPPPKGRK